jgi:hypothetical protein
MKGEAMSKVGIREYVESAIDDESLERAHIKSAGNVIAHFLLVREGLTGHVPNEELNAVAATLTAAISSSESQAGGNKQGR